MLAVPGKMWVKGEHQKISRSTPFSVEMSFYQKALISKKGICSSSSNRLEQMSNITDKSFNFNIAVYLALIACFYLQNSKFNFSNRDLLRQL